MKIKVVRKDSSVIVIDLDPSGYWTISEDAITSKLTMGTKGFFFTKDGTFDGSDKQVYERLDDSGIIV